SFWSVCRSDRTREVVSYSYPATAFQPVRFKRHSASVYRSFICQLVSVADAHSYALHGVVMHVAHARAQHRSRSRRIGYGCAGLAGKGMRPVTRTALSATV